MDFKVVWTDSAIEDLKSIAFYISKDNRSAAAATGFGILDHAKLLETFPFIGPTYPRGSKGSIREIVYGNYRIFYEVIEKSQFVNILRVWHGARGTPEI